MLQQYLKSKGAHIHKFTNELRTYEIIFYKFGPQDKKNHHNALQDIINILEPNIPVKSECINVRVYDMSQ